MLVLLKEVQNNQSVRKTAQRRVPFSAVLNANDAQLMKQHLKNYFVQIRGVHLNHLMVVMESHDVLS